MRLQPAAYQSLFSHIKPSVAAFGVNQSCSPGAGVYEFTSKNLFVYFCTIPSITYTWQFSSVKSERAANKSQTFLLYHKGIERSLIKVLWRMTARNTACVVRIFSTTEVEIPAHEAQILLLYQNSIRDPWQKSALQAPKQQIEPDTKPTECEDQRQGSFEAMTAISPSALHPTVGELPQGAPGTCSVQAGDGHSWFGWAATPALINNCSRKGFGQGRFPRGKDLAAPNQALQDSALEFLFEATMVRRMRSLGLWQFGVISPAELVPSFPGTAASLLFALASP